MKDMQHLGQAVLSEIEALQARAIENLRKKVAPQGKPDAALMETHQHAVHALSWLATYVEALKQLSRWSERVSGEMESLILRIGFGEYLTQISGGIMMSQNEFARLSDLEVEWQPSEAALAP